MMIAASLALTGSARAETPELKSENVATNASIAGTFAPIAMLVAASQVNDDKTSDALALAGAAGLLLAPSAGHWYSGQLMTRGLGLRLGGVAVTSGAILLAMGDSCVPLCDGQTSDLDGDDSMLVVIGLAGAGLFAAGVIHDIVTADDAARDYNNEQARRVTIAPTAGRDQMGVAVIGSF